MSPKIGVSESALLTDIAMCVNYYRLFSPGLDCCVHAPLQLDDGTRWQPGIIVMINHGELKQCDPGPNYDCFTGPPNFVLDVFPGDDLLDYENRRTAFERAKVLEYVAVRHTDPVSWIWNRLVAGKFTEIETADNEYIISTALPGLRIPAVAFSATGGPSWVRSHVVSVALVTTTSWRQSGGPIQAGHKDRDRGPCCPRGVRGPTAISMASSHAVRLAWQQTRCPRRRKIGEQGIKSPTLARHVTKSRVCGPKC